MDAVSALTEKERTEQLSRQKEGEKKESGQRIQKGGKKPGERMRSYHHVLSLLLSPSLPGIPDRAAPREKTAERN